MTLYEINEAILSCVDMETGEVIDPEKLEALQMAEEEKIENICCWIKDLNAEAKALKEEAESLTQRRKTAENKVESLKRYIAIALDGRKFKTAKASVSYRSSDSTEIFDLSAIPEKYLKYAEPTADKTAIKDAIKSGEDVPGAVIVSKTSVLIK